MSVVNEVDIKNVIQTFMEDTSVFPRKLNSFEPTIEIHPSRVASLTDLRVECASKLFRNLLVYNNISKKVLLCQNPVTTADKDNILIIIGPVVHPNSKKKVIDVSPEKYYEIRKECSRIAGKNETKKEEIDSLTKAVICYDFLHCDLTKSVTTLALGSMENYNTDPLFREAAKILYNRSRICSILEKHNQGINSNLYSVLPALHETDFSWLKRSEEINIVHKYISKFYSIITTEDGTSLEKIPSKLWQFLLFLSQDFSVYYGRIRVLNVKQCTIQIKMFCPTTFFIFM